MECAAILCVLESDSVNANQDKEKLDVLVDDLRHRLEGSEFPSQLVPRLDTPFLSTFIRTKNYNNEAALFAVQKLYRNISRNLNYIQPDSRPSEVTSAFSSDTIGLLKSRIRGCRVGVLRLGNWNPKQVSIRDLQLAAYFLSERLIREVETQEKGFILVVDLTGLTFEQLWKLNLKELRIIMGNVQEGLPIRIAEIHFLNPPRFFWSMYKIIMLFLKDKIRKRVKLHYSLESLQESMDVEVLPQCLGGPLEDIEAFEYKLTDEILKYDLPYKESWSGSYGK